MSQMDRSNGLRDTQTQHISEFSKTVCPYMGAFFENEG